MGVALGFSLLVYLSVSYTPMKVGRAEALPSSLAEILGVGELLVSEVRELLLLFLIKKLFRNK
jgi:hypothetical protein